MEIFKFILKITVELLILYSYITLAANIYSNVKLSLANKGITAFFCLIISILVELLRKRLAFFIYLVCFIPLALIQKFIFKSSINNILISDLILYIIISVGEMSAYITKELLSKTILLNLASSDGLFFMYTFFKCIYITLIMVSLFKYLSKNSSEVHKILENFEEKYYILMLAVFLLTTLSINFCYHILTNSLTTLTFNNLHVFINSMLVFIVFKYISAYHQTKDELVEYEIYNKTLCETVDSLRLLKHDYNNILQSINGYIITKQYDGLDAHIKKLISNAREISNLECISPKVINQPAIYGVVGAKYYRAKKRNVPLKVEVLEDISSISLDFTKLSRVLGILLDNAIEAAEKADTPNVALKFSYDDTTKIHKIEIKNSFESGKTIDTNKIFEKGESSKKNKSGLGLWEVKKIISSCKNASICASVKSNDFVQTLLAWE